MNNMGGLLQQAQQMQRKMLEIEKKLNEMEVSGEVSNGLVKVIMTRIPWLHFSIIYVNCLIKNKKDGEARS